MKFLAVVFLMTSVAFAQTATKTETKTEGHDVEHKHVTEKVDHSHAQEHHTESAEAHKAHHPGHVESKTTTTKKAVTK